MNKLDATRRAMLLGAFAMSATRCASAQTFDQEWRGAMGGGPNQSTELARETADWNILWSRLRQPTPAPLPAGAMAVGITLGTRPTGGFGIRVDSARPENGVFVVTWSEVAPAPGTFVTQALTDPYLVRLFPRTDLPVRVQKAG